MVYELITALILMKAFTTIVVGLAVLWALQQCLKWSVTLLKATTIGNTKGETKHMKYVIDMRTLTVVSLELDDTNVHDKEVLMNIETTTGRLLPVAIKETLLNEEEDY